MFYNKYLSDSDKDKRKKTAVEKLSKQKKLKASIAKSKELPAAPRKAVEELSDEEMVNFIEHFDIDKYEYSSDEKFIKIYASKFQTLEYVKQICDKYLNDNEDISEKLMPKIGIISDIYEEYTQRKELISSPYYVLLANRDMKKFQEEEGQRRLEFLNDKGASDYINKYLKLASSKVGKKKDFGDALKEKKKTAKADVERHKQYKREEFRRRMREEELAWEREKREAREAEIRAEEERVRAAKEPQMIEQRDSGENEMKEKLVEGKDIAEDYRSFALKSRERQLSESERYLAKYKQIKEDCLNGKILPGDNDYYTQERIDQIIAEKEKDVEENRKWRDRVRDFKKEDEVPLIIAKDSYYSDQMDDRPSTEPLFPEGKRLTVCKENKQGLNTCYFMAVIYGLIESGHEDYIKNMIREYGNDGTQAVVRLYDAEGLPVDIVVSKTRMKNSFGNEKRDMWVHVLEKAVQVMLCKSSFKTIKGSVFKDYEQGGGITKNVDYKALSEKCKAGEDFCEEAALSKYFISKSSEPVGYQLIFGKTCVRYDNRGNLDNDEAHFSELGNKNIGRMKELLRQGKCIIGSTAAKGDSTYWIDRAKNKKDERGEALDPEHVLYFKSVDEDTQTIVAADSLKGGERTFTFEEFRSVVMDIYVSDMPKAVTTKKILK